MAVGLAVAGSTGVTGRIVYQVNLGPPRSLLYRQREEGLELRDGVLNEQESLVGTAAGGGLLVVHRSSVLQDESELQDVSSSERDWALEWVSGAEAIPRQFQSELEP